VADAPAYTPALDALLREVADMDAHDSCAPRLAAIVRVMVEAMREATFCEECSFHVGEARAAIARAEAIAKGD